MGTRYEVWAWRRTQPASNIRSGYEYVLEYRGQSSWRALRAAINAKRTCGCVKVEWRS